MLIEKIKNKKKIIQKVNPKKKIKIKIPENESALKILVNKIK